MRKLFVFFSVCALLVSPPARSQSEPITLEKLYRDGYFRPESIVRGKSMQNGQSYSLIIHGTDLNVYACETNELLRTAFSSTGSLTDDTGNALTINDYSFSKDERKLLVGVNEKQIYRHSRSAIYYIIDLLNGQISPLTEGEGQRLPEFSPDGNKVAYVKENNIFVKDLQHDETRQITFDGANNEIINGTADWVYEEEFKLTKGFHWSPDGRYIAYYRFDESRVKEFNMMMYGSLYPEEYRFKYPKAGEDNSFVSIHIYDLHSGQLIQADTGGEGDYYIPRIQWTRDSGLLAIQKLNRHQNRLEVLLASAETGSTSLLYVDNNLYYISINDDLTFLRDGHHFIISSEKSGYNHLYLYDMQGREVRPLTSGEYDVERFLGYDEAHELIYYLAREDTPFNNALYSVRIKGQEKTRLSRADGINNPSFNIGFRFYINEFSTINTPPVYSMHRADGSLVNVLKDNNQLTNRLTAHGFNPYSFFTFTTSDNVALNGMMLRPPDFDPLKKYPVLMYVYGGPGSQTVVNRWNATNGVWFQMLAQMGFVVVSVDNRGTGFRGEGFKKMTYLELGKYETADQIEAAIYLASLPYIDESRIGIFGWSYGGYMSLLCLAKGHAHFAAAISVAPVTNWRFYDSVYTERYMRTPQENPHGYDDNSPMSHAGKIKGPLLLVHGSADDNVHYQNTMEMTSALIDEGIPFDMMIYPDHNHGIGGSGARMHLYRMMTDFLVRHLKR